MVAGAGEFARLDAARPRPRSGAVSGAGGTLDGLHLASVLWLRATGESVELASYDARLTVAAQALGISLAAL